jgi:hypoxanthine-guanine phosphoribosyltransferase
MLLNSKKFGLIIEDIVKKKRVSYMEAVLKYCEENELDTGTVSSLINKSLKEKIQIEAENLNLLEKSNTSKLPI